MGSNPAGSTVTPLHIEIALHYFKYRDSTSLTYAGNNGELAEKIHREFIDAGLLEATSNNRLWKATNRLRQYIEILCKTPLSINEPKAPSDKNYQLDNLMRRSNKFIGEETINTRNSIIAAAMNEYLASTRSRLNFSKSREVISSMCFFIGNSRCSTVSCAIRLR